MNTDSPYLQLLDWAWAEHKGKPFTVWLLEQRDPGEDGKPKKSLREIRDELLLITDGAVAVSPTSLKNWEDAYRVEEERAAAADAGAAA